MAKRTFSGTSINKLSTSKYKKGTKTIKDLPPELYRNIVRSTTEPIPTKKENRMREKAASARHEVTQSMYEPRDIDKVFRTNNGVDYYRESAKQRITKKRNEIASKLRKNVYTPAITKNLTPYFVKDNERKLYNTIHGNKSKLLYLLILKNEFNWL